MTRKEKISMGYEKPKTKKYEDPEKICIKNILDEEQKRACNIINHSALTLLLGKFGTGKTLTACAYALSELLAGRIEKIVISRPSASEEHLGYLPGGIEDKMGPLVMPIIRNMYRIVNPKNVDYWLDKKIIEMIPLEYFRGITLTDKCIGIIDEIQNTTVKQMKTIVTRIGTEGKLILCGDRRQCDLAPNKSLGLNALINFKSSHFSIIELTNNHRHPIVEELANYFDNIEDKK